MLLKINPLHHYTLHMRSAVSLIDSFIGQLKGTLAEQLLDSLKSKIKFVC
jgi:hypothetical protein